MKTMKKQMVRLAIIAAAFTLVTPANAYPLDVYQLPSPIQDNWVIPPTVHELGINVFPPNELIQAAAVSWQGHIPCTSEYQGGGAVQIRMQNLTGKLWTDLWYVGDPETSFSNWDEYVGQVGFTAWRAFKIDAIGANTPLVFESVLADGIFQPGEIWEFVIQEYNNGLGAPPWDFSSIGIAGASAGWPPSSGSIVAWVPEPGSIVLIALGGLALLWRRRS